ncbi:MAG: hypothetical protein E6R07_14620 [Nevskiaceae bacterium]|nr:MAG: hypothetical protein E6R07_14620 [Nevskiaceae bacterium]
MPAPSTACRGSRRFGSRRRPGRTPPRSRTRRQASSPQSDRSRSRRSLLWRLLHRLSGSGDARGKGKSGCRSPHHRAGIRDPRS